MTIRAGYWADLCGVQFEESTNTTWIQAMPLGKYEHPFFGEINITPARVKRFADGVTNKVRETDLDIDYDHKMTSGEAAGWVQAAEARKDGLYLLVEWTEDAAKKIKAKAYRYFSPEFTDEWTHPKTQQTFKDVLLGGGITNRPFLKDIMPINMSEVLSHAGDQLNEGGKTAMTPEQLKELAKSLGLSEDATAEQVLEAASKQTTSPSTPTPATPDPQLKELSESNPAVKALMDTVNTLGEQVQQQRKELSEARAKGTVASLSDLAAKGKRGLPAVVLSTLTEGVQLSEGNAGAQKLLEAVTKLCEIGFVSLGEDGHERNQQTDNTAKQFTDKIEELRKAKPELSYADAAVIAAAENEVLFEGHRSDSYVREGVI